LSRSQVDRVEALLREARLPRLDRFEVGGVVGVDAVEREHVQPPLLRGVQPGVRDLERDADRPLRVGFRAGLGAVGLADADAEGDVLRQPEQRVPECLGLDVVEALAARVHRHREGDDRVGDDVLRLHAGLVDELDESFRRDQRVTGDEDLLSLLEEELAAGASGDGVAH